MPRANNRRHLSTIGILSIPLWGVFYGILLRATGTFLTMLARSIVPAYIVPTVGFQIAIPALASVMLSKTVYYLCDKILNWAQNNTNPEIRQAARRSNEVHGQEPRSQFAAFYDVPGITVSLALANVASPGILASETPRYAIATAGAFLGYMFKKGLYALSSSPEVDNVADLGNNNSAARPILGM